MYTLLSGLYKYLTEKDEYFVLILGLDNAGKTTFLESAKARLTPNYKVSCHYAVIHAVTMTTTRAPTWARSPPPWA